LRLADRLGRLRSQLRWPPMTVPNPRHTVQWQQLRKRVIASAQYRGDSCYRCGQPIDYTLSGRHMWGPTVDHTYSIAEHPELAYVDSLLKVSHRRCNLRYGASLGGRRLAAKRAALNGHTPTPQPNYEARW
jgi:5-methylcytosine-specific restriction endonuclease McrA